MQKTILITCLAAATFLTGTIVLAQDSSWTPGGPKYIYVKPGKKPARHMPYDKELKCISCHKWDGTDAYSSATMGLKKSTTGRLPKAEIEKAIVAALKGNGNHREMYALATSFNNKPLATCIEFTLDPKTMIFYASSEKQTEKLFHIAANPNASLVWVKPRTDVKYFIDPMGVQVVGKAEQLKLGDPGFEEALQICLATVHLPPGVTLTEPMLKNIRKNQLITKITPQRIVMTSHEFRAKGQHLKQIWEP
ncbi:MAG: pyridoxamine 5'-phosphate oxidase family protein [Deltaproteobacteria bacterium]|nr:pyridoxamine 5'-phosphate oxidase family protein [Deltaproteobacteria bacterium]